MNEDHLNDLKQFIASTVSQTEARLQSQITQLQNGLTEFRSETANGFEGVSEAIEQIHQQAEAQEAEVDRRFTKLEQQIA